MRKICPICGREESKNLPFVGGICVECYLNKNPLEIKAITLNKCKICGKIRYKNDWIFANENFYSEIFAKEVEKNNKKKFIQFGLDLKAVPYKEKVLVTVQNEIGKYETYLDPIIDYKFTICPQCLARKAGSYDSVIQIRGTNKLDFEDKKIIMNLIEKLPYDLKQHIVTITENKDWIDVEIVGHEKARLIASFLSEKLGGETKQTFKLISTKKGERNSRLTISLRIDKRREVGEIVEHQGSPAVIIERTSRFLKLFKLKERKEIKLDLKEIRKNVKTFEGEIKSVTVQAVLPDRVIVIDDSYNVDNISFQNVYGEPSKGEKGRIVFTENDLFLVIP
ncbi:60S ribosomal export protein NMD3 [Fervidicoccus fontis]|jgi:NMD protein affecting ribosome stability and mRNA decay|uniref:Nmd3 N-terminal domain-containing protein n=2 Tax=Fervidicoccus fontis TaxID=683846 RepID=I0A1F2_FERFK|nr:60S ribosomal export protein NMD3 [Fervidicoccus fontis]AFH42809.1 hypothetical protein FFONT_0821 [Fervidicoccus fontis Kam940]MBE9391595.1 60S ribosomal export protein NMD3 [Fervidicoccus fontis]PMB76304.1 MAG: DNA gyrase inhibitor YacG [Fervidicoccus fontis]HEW63779.1 hypothetical protein [Fervidicoccus fontis]